MDSASIVIPCHASGQESSSPPPCPETQLTRAMLEQQLHERNQRGWRRVALHFTPSWFAATMGTGITSILLHNLPYNAEWLRWIAIVVFVLNVVLFTLFTVISIVRYTVYKGLFLAMLRHPVQSLFLGTFPMGLATIINMIVYVCVPAWGSWVLTLAWALWWIDAVISVACCMFLPFAIMHIHPTAPTSTPKLQTMTAVWLLPIVAPIVASASGSVLATALPPTHALWTLITSYVLLGLGLPLALVVLAMYFQRLTIHRLPPREVIVSVFLPLGPLGQGSFALIQLGRVAREIIPTIAATAAASESDGVNSSTLLTNPASGAIIATLSTFLALLMWSFGLVWLFLALASLSRGPIPFNMGWWAFTFPLGVYSAATISLGSEVPSAFFRVLGTVFALCVLALWAVVAARTAWGLWLWARHGGDGGILWAPCVKAFEKDWIARELKGWDAEKTNTTTTAYDSRIGV